MWWKKRDEPRWTPVLQREDIDYPTGTFVRCSTGVYFIKGKGKFKVPTERVLESWKPNSVAAHANGIENFVKAGTLGFRDGTLIGDISTRKVYLIAGAKRRLIADPDAFDKYGLNRDNVVEVSAEEANLHVDGEPLA